MLQEFFINNKTEMVYLARKIAKETQEDLKKIICLSGDLGTGKSFFAQNFINYFQDKASKVLSPTFNIVYSYETKIGEIFHFDLYRIKNFQDLENTGFFDIIKDSYCLIEWPEIAEDFLKKIPQENIKKISIESVFENNYANENNSEKRKVKIWQYIPSSQENK